MERRGVVQLVRTPAYHKGGGGFESRRSRHKLIVKRRVANSMAHSPHGILAQLQSALQGSIAENGRC